MVYVITHIMTFLGEFLCFLFDDFLEIFHLFIFISITYILQRTQVTKDDQAIPRHSYHPMGRYIN